MRITGGKLGGRRLIAPEDAGVRPTSDRTRQAIFNILRHKDFDMGFTLEDAVVADLFAGTGALGIEALSHGALYMCNHRVGHPMVAMAITLIAHSIIISYKSY